MRQYSCLVRLKLDIQRGGQISGQTVGQKNFSKFNVTNRSESYICVYSIL